MQENPELQIHAVPRARGSIWKWLFASAAVAVLAACGGGGGASADIANPANATLVQGTLSTGLVVPTASEASAASVVTSSDGTGLVLANRTGSMQSIKTGQVVVLPSNDTQGLPMGFTGIASVQSDGSIKLTPASISDVFKTLKVDFDSARDGGQIAGLIVPRNGKMTMSQSPAPSTQSGLDMVLCQIGLNAVVNVKCKNGALEGSITLEHPVMVKEKGGTKQAQAKLYATIGISNFSSKANIDYDFEKYASTGGFNILKSEVTGAWSASMGIKLDDKAFQAEIPAWSELIRGDSANIWDENTKIKFGKYFELSGINGDDKKGLIPLGGIYITPTNYVAGGQGFGGELTAAQLGQIKRAGIILWLYINMSGKVALSGDLKFFEATGGGFDKGFKLERVNGSLTNTIINTETPANVLAPRITGKVEATQNIGLAIAADLLVAGVRPATVKSTLIGVNATASVEGDGGYRWTPSPAAFEGSLCAHAGIKLVSNIEFNAAVNAKLDAGWFSGSGRYEQKFGPAEKVWGEKNYDGCVNTFTLPLVQKGMAADTVDASKTKVEMSFAEAYNNVSLRSQVGRWQIFEEGPFQTKFYDADISFGGLFTVSLPAGSYKFTVVALHKDLKDTMGQPLVIATSSAVSVNVTAAPLIDFTWSIVGGDCTKLQLSSTATVSGSGVLSSYKWTVTPANGVASTQAGASLSLTTFTLGSCGSVSVSHQVTDSMGVSTSLVRSVETSTLAPTVTSITPVTATIGVATNFIVTGTNLSLTAVLSIADGSCATPTNRTSTGFTVSCTPGGSGAKAVSVLAATGGVVIDATKILTVAANTQVYSFFDSFDGSDIEPTKWTRVLHPTYAGTGATVSAGDLQLRVGAYLHTYGKAVFSGSKIVIESVAGDADATMLLLDTFNPLTGWSTDVILASDTTYRGWGFDVQTTGRYAIVGPTTAGTITIAEGANVLINSQHKPEMLYRRLTVDGNVVTSERGAGADAITERLSTQMASSMVGRPMTLVVSTGVGPYTPGRFQWIRVTVTP